MNTRTYRGRLYFVTAVQILHNLYQRGVSSICSAYYAPFLRFSNFIAKFGTLSYTGEVASKVAVVVTITRQFPLFYVGLLSDTHHIWYVDLRKVSKIA